MAKKDELFKLESQLESAKRKMEEAFDSFQRARKNVTTTYAVMMEKEARCVFAEKRVKYEKDLYQREERRYNEKWEAYHYIKDEKDPRIAKLTKEADIAHKEMCDHYVKATNGEKGNITSKALLELGKIAELRYDALQSEIRSLKEEIRDMFLLTRALAPEVDTSTYERAQKLLELAKKELEAATANYEAAKYEKAKMEKAYEAAKKDFEKVKREIAAFEAS